MVQFGQGYISVSLKNNPRVSRLEMLAVLPVDGRSLCERRGQTRLVRRSRIVLYTPLIGANFEHAIFGPRYCSSSVGLGPS